MKHSQDLRGVGALVTGASRGLGAHLVEALAERGARVAMVARGEPELLELATRLRQRGADVHALAYDVGDRHAVYPLVGSAQALLGSIDVLVHNASTLGPTPLRLLLDTECEDLSRVLEVNLLGPFRLSKAVARSMALRGFGTIVHVSSDAAQEAYERWGAYSVSKAALDHLSRLWAKELETSGVRVFSVDPGEMDTQMHRDAIPEADPATLADPAWVAERITQLIVDGSRAPSGSRLKLSELSEAS